MIKMAIWSYFDRFALLIMGGTTVIAVEGSARADLHGVRHGQPG
jgi:hypothetical protein